MFVRRSSVVASLSLGCLSLTHTRTRTRTLSPLPLWVEAAKKGLKQKKKDLPSRLEEDAFNARQT